MSISHVRLAIVVVTLATSPALGTLIENQTFDPDAIEPDFWGYTGQDVTPGILVNAYPGITALSGNFLVASIDNTAKVDYGSFPLIDDSLRYRAEVDYQVIGFQEGDRLSIHLGPFEQPGEFDPTRQRTSLAAGETPLSESGTLAIEGNAKPRPFDDVQLDLLVNIEAVNSGTVIAIDNIRMTELPRVEWDPADLNFDEVVDAEDIDYFFSNQTDLNGDSQVNADDADYLIEVLFQTSFGDANLNGLVEQGDLDAVLSNWGQTDGVGWASGDLNGHGQVEQADLDTVLANWGNGAPLSSGATGVPEPAAAAMASILAMVLSRHRFRA